MNEIATKAITPGAGISVSTVIITYNHGRYMSRAIRSALAQTYQPHEVIVVDDGSTDGTGDLVRKEFGSRVGYVFQENRGMGAARNLGIRMSKGDCIAFLDADDWWVPQKLELQMQALSKHPSAGMVVCEAINYDPAGKELSRTHLPRPFTRNTIREGLKIRTIFPVTAVVRRNVFDEVGGFSETLHFGTDREMWARVAARFEIIGVDQPLLNIAELPTSNSSDPHRILRYGFDLNRQVVKALASNSHWGCYKDKLAVRRADAKILREAAKMFADRGDPRRAAINMFRSLWRWPFTPPEHYLRGARFCVVWIIPFGANRAKKATS